MCHIGQAQSTPTFHTAGRFMSWSELNSNAGHLVCSLLQISKFGPSHGLWSSQCRNQRGLDLGMFYILMPEMCCESKHNPLHCCEETLF